MFQNIADIENGPAPTGITVVPGDIRYVDRNKDNVIDDQDKFVLGNPFPRYTYGFNYAVSWKQLDISSIFIQGVGKRDMFLRGELESLSITIMDKLCTSINSITGRQSIPMPSFQGWLL